jgi:tRNA threonylcarbamoyladenosine biosynthesis protein TsaB
LITLAIDASTYVGDVAVLDGAQLLAEASVAMKGPEHEALMPAVATCLERAAVSVRDVGRIVCGAGPGSFTSLRIAGSIAKGIAVGVPCPLLAVPSMALILGGSDGAPGSYLVAVDALRSEFYVGIYERTADGAVDEVAPSRIVGRDDVEHVASGLGIRIVSPSSFEGAIRAAPRARVAGMLGRTLRDRVPVDLATWEPSYGRLAEAQVKWELAHGRALSTAE